MLDVEAFHVRDPGLRERATQASVVVNRGLLQLLFARTVSLEYQVVYLAGRLDKVQGVVADQVTPAKRKDHSANSSELFMANHMDAIEKPRLTTKLKKFPTQRKGKEDKYGSLLTLMCTDAALAVSGGLLGSALAVHDELRRVAGLTTPALSFPLARLEGFCELLKERVSAGGAGAPHPWVDTKRLLGGVTLGVVRDACKKLRSAVQRILQPGQAAQKERVAKALKTLCPKAEAEPLRCKRYAVCPPHVDSINISDRQFVDEPPTRRNMDFLSWEGANGAALAMEEVSRRQRARFEAVSAFVTADTPFDYVSLLAASEVQALCSRGAEQPGGGGLEGDGQTSHPLAAMLYLTRVMLGVIRDQAYSLARDVPQLPIDAQWHTLSHSQLYIAATVFGPIWTFLRGEDGCAITWGYITKAFQDSMMEDPKVLAQKVQARVAETLKGQGKGTKRQLSDPTKDLEPDTKRRLNAYKALLLNT